ncbi:alpha-amylase [Clostridia bacterium]|nr:alpha-amylase [Clostridia bacterium]
MSDEHNHQNAELDQTLVSAITTALEGNKSPSSTVTGSDDSAANIASDFAALPIESLIVAPVIAAARGQQQLTATYIDGIMKLAYADGKAGAVNTLDFTYDRPVTTVDQTGNSQITSQSYTLKAPLLSLVPVSAFTMDELTVDFDMEVKNSSLQDDKSHSDAGTVVKYNSWFGLDASITGNVSSDSEHKRTSDTTATYKVHVRAVQQPPSEGMAKLTALFAQTMEPLKAGSNPPPKP